LHLQFDVERGIPDHVQIGSAVGSEKKALRAALRAGCLYVVDRGFIEYGLFQAIHEAESFFVARLKDNSTFEVLSNRILTPADQAAGVMVDQHVRMGSRFTAGELTAPVRRIEIRGADRERRDVILLTNTDLPAEIVALIYRYRWQVELFFRWFKCILGCRHWLSESERGLTLQVYVAILASLLISLWTGHKPTRRTFEMIVLHLQGWASADEVQAHLARLQKNAK
jgi:IS4 transposase